MSDVGKPAGRSHQAETGRSVDGSEVGRPQVLDKLGQTAREAEALGSTIANIPEDVVWQRPGDSPSIAELLWLIHLADEYRFRPVVDAMANGLEPRLGLVNANVLLGTDEVPESDVGAILTSVASSRARLVATLETLPAPVWEEPSVIVAGVGVDGREFCEGIAQHDAAILAEVASRIHGSNLGSSQ